MCACARVRVRVRAVCIESLVNVQVKGAPKKLGSATEMGSLKQVYELLPVAHR